MCNCSNQQIIIPNSKSMVENDIDNNKFNVVNDIKANSSEEKKEKILNNGKINIDQNNNNDAETYNNISSKGALLTPKSILLKVTTSSISTSAIGDLLFGLICLIVFIIISKLTLLQIQYQKKGKKNLKEEIL